MELFTGGPHRLRELQEQMRRQKDLAFLRKRREHRKFIREFTKYARQRPMANL